MRRFSTFLTEAEYKGKIVSLDHPFRLRDDPEFEKGVYVQDDDSHETKFIRYGKKDKDNSVRPNANPQSTDTPKEEKPKKSSPKYWEDKENGQ